MKKLIAILTLALLVGVVSSCKKYEEGPGFSFRSKKARVANTWVIDEYVYSDGDIDKVTESGNYTFEKDGTFLFEWGSSVSEKGTWEFTSDKEEIKWIYNDGSYTEKYTIIKLKEKEFWIADEDNDQIHFLPKS